MLCVLCCETTSAGVIEDETQVLGKRACVIDVSTRRRLEACV